MAPKKKKGERGTAKKGTARKKETMATDEATLAPWAVRCHDILRTPLGVDAVVLGVSKRVSGVRTRGGAAVAGVWTLESEVSGLWRAGGGDRRMETVGQSP